MPTRVRERDNGAKALLKRLRGVADRPVAVSVGVLEEKGNEQHGDDDVTVADVATFNEFGLGVPQRSFIREWADENEAELSKAQQQIGMAVLKGKVDPDKAADRFGVFAVGNCQQRIIAGIAPPNAESTVERKGSSTPLIDESILLTSITYKV